MGADKYEGHTPGLWRYARWDAQPHYLVEVNLPCINGVAAWFALAHVFIPDEAEVGYTDGAHSEEAAEANARLIADAPTLLAENRRLREALELIESQADDLCGVASKGNRPGDARNWKQIADIATAALKEAAA